MRETPPRVAPCGSPPAALAGGARRVISSLVQSCLLTPLLRFDAKPGNGLEALLVALRITTVDAVRAGHCCPASHPDAARRARTVACGAAHAQLQAHRLPSPSNRHELSHSNRTMRAAPAYSKPTAAAQRKRGPRPRPRPRSGRPLEAADAPVINGLFAHGRGDSRQATPPEKENRRGDDVFMAQAELRALEALNAKLQEDLIKLEELNQTLEIEKSEAVSQQQATEKKVRRLELELRDGRRDFEKAEHDAEEREREARRCRDAGKGRYQ